MISINRCLKILEDGFSIITVGESKIPNFPWKRYQTEKIDTKVFESNFNYKGGIIKKDGSEIPKTEHVGIVTGFNYLEVVDVDLKVFSTAKEQKDFWNEYLSFLEDNILDFHEKFTIVKTQNAGFHILYKTKRVQGNQKVAWLKGHNEAIIETRGTGGYVLVYSNCLNG